MRNKVYRFYANNNVLIQNIYINNKAKYKKKHLLTSLNLSMSLNVFLD